MGMPLFEFHVMHI